MIYLENSFFRLRWGIIFMKVLQLHEKVVIKVPYLHLQFVCQSMQYSILGVYFAAFDWKA